MNVPIAEIVSRTRTKRSDIKILFTCVATHGPVPLSRAIVQPFTHLQTDRMKLTPVDTAVKTFHDLEFHRRLRVQVRLWL
jgi:hypothetical protein